MAKGTRLLKPLQEKIFLQNSLFQLIHKNDKILIALSGGPDSVFLLHFLHKFQKHFSVTLGAIHVNHRLRGKDAVADEEFCKALCKSLAIPLAVYSVRLPDFAKQHNMSLEEAGRKARYHFFANEKKKNGYTKIATAHTIDDNAESVLLNMVKGSGITGLTGIAPIYEDSVIRPLLKISKPEILTYLDSVNIEYRVDKSNEDIAYQRNFLRKEVIPSIKQNLNPDFSEAVLRLSDTARGCLNFLEPEIVKSYNMIISSTAEKWEIDLHGYRMVNPFIASECLKRLIQSELKLSSVYHAVQELNSLIHSNVGKRSELSAAYCAVRERSSVVISLSQANDKIIDCQFPITEGIYDIEGCCSIKVTQQPAATRPDYSEENTAFFDADKISSPLTVRVWRAADRFIPYGMKSSKKVSDFLTDLKIPAIQKQQQIVVCSNEQIIWVAAKRIDERVKITPNTKNILKLKVTFYGSH
ncbi:MAG: tRNA lysidine(34) synthetase TilS [Ignavibacteria bacterium]|nr:tRNA lysidine(34) synthetase TilS [Ignavibacteria bacterium]